MRKTVLLIAAFSCASFAHAQTAPVSKPIRPNNDYGGLVPKPARAPEARSKPVFSSPPEAYSGISGPGQPVIGDGSGGYRTGNDGVLYKGPDPKPGWKTEWGNRANGSAYKAGLLPHIKPIWDLHLRDTTIALAGDGNYYMTGSSGDNIWDIVDGVELWKSADLKKWEYLGLVWSVDRDGTWEKKYRRVWAPEIHYIKHTFCITYSMQGGGTGILISKNGKPEGPYTNPIAADKPLTNGIDATIFEDDNGKVYFTSNSASSITPMKDDLSGYDGESHRISFEADPNRLNGRKNLGHEGASLFKANGKYYLGAADTYQGRYSSICALADTIYGPYSKIHEAVPCGGGTNYFEDKEGNWWDCVFGNDDGSSWREKPGIVKVEFAADGTIVVSKEQPEFVLADAVRKEAATRP